MKPKLPGEKLERAMCIEQGCRRALIALADISMETGLHGEDGSLEPGYVCAYPLAWRDDKASLILEAVHESGPREVTSFDVYAPVCPVHGEIDRDRLVEYVETLMHQRRS